MADKKGKPGDPAAAPAPGAPPPGPDAEKKPVEPKKKSEQPKDEVGTRKGCRRYKWEFKDSNREFWSLGHAEVKLISLVSWAYVPGCEQDVQRREEGEGVGSLGLLWTKLFAMAQRACLPAGLLNRFADNVHGDHCAPHPDTHHHYGDVHLHLLHHYLHLRHPEILALHPMAYFCK